MKRSYAMIGGFLLLLASEILRVYFIMPFPGSQRSNTIGLAYFLDRNINWIRLLGIILVLPGLWHTVRQGGRWQKIAVAACLFMYLGIFYLFNFRFLADKMFYQPAHKQLVTASNNRVDTNALVIGVAIGGQAKAYPIQIIGYHHQVRDTIGGQPAIVTYCTVCRSGRVYSPILEQSNQVFRLVGMDHFNAMFEDVSTKSWWQQATGEAIAGPQKGKKLQELPSAQMRLGAWMQLYPQTLVLQPDQTYSARYANLAGYDSGTIESNLEKRDSSSWAFKSWIIGLTAGSRAKAYDWNKLTQDRLIQDTLGSLPIVLILENDGSTFHAWSRLVQGKTLNFSWNVAGDALKDADTQSSWDMDGVCRQGKFAGAQLDPVQSYQEFWHSWSQFHPQSSRFQ